MFGEFCSCCSLPLLPDFACSIHATWGPPLSRALYINVQQCASTIFYSFIGRDKALKTLLRVLSSNVNEVKNIRRRTHLYNLMLSQFFFTAFGFDYISFKRALQSCKLFYSAPSQLQFSFLFLSPSLSRLVNVLLVYDTTMNSFS